LSGPTNTWPLAVTAMPRREVPTPGSTTATCTVPPGNTPAAASTARAPSVMSCRSMSWVTSTRWTRRVAARVAGVIRAPYWSRPPKSVVRVTMIGSLTGGRTSAVAIHHEVGDEREDLPLLAGGERLEISLGRGRVRVGARPRVLHAVVLQHEPADLLDLGRG